MALGEMEMGYDEFLMITPRAFYNKVKGYHRKQEVFERQHWERVRIMVWGSLQPYFEQGKSLKPKEIIPLPWDAEEGGSGSSAIDEKIARKNAIWEKIDKQKKRGVEQ